MRRFTLFMLIVVALAATYSRAKDETIDELKTRFQNAHVDERPQLGIRIAFAQLHNADTLYREGKVEEATAAVGDIVSYSEKATDAATQTKKRLKNVEIDVRKIADKLRDIKRTLAFEDQPPVEQAVRRLEDLRTALLKEMFADDKKKVKK
jgi:soluble cytochrome b562